MIAEMKETTALSLLLSNGFSLVFLSAFLKKKIGLACTGAQISQETSFETGYTYLLHYGKRLNETSNAFMFAVTDPLWRPVPYIGT